MGFTGLISQLKKLLIFLGSERPNSVLAQLQDKNKAKEQYAVVFFQGNDPTSKSPHKKYDHTNR